MQTAVARTRGLLTENDRKVLTGEADVSENRRQQVVWEVRKRIEDEMVRDVEVLAEARPGLLDELREVVCEEE